MSSFLSKPSTSFPASVTTTPADVLSDQLQLEIDILRAEAGLYEPLASRHPEAVVPDGRTVLVVDDDPDMRAYLRRCLKQEHELSIGRILEAEDGRAALALARQGGIDLIITDVVMPGLDGLALCRALQANAALRDVPVLLITGKTEPENLPVTAHGVLRKPFNASKLHAWLVHLLTEVSGRSPPPARPP